jgi:hypothetical protein
VFFTISPLSTREITLPYSILQNGTEKDDFFLKMQFHPRSNKIYKKDKSNFGRNAIPFNKISQN